MKTITTLIGFITCTVLLGQTVGIFGSTNLSVNNTGTYANPSAVFDISSSDKGLLIPRLSKAQRDGIGTPATSLIIYQTDNAPGYYFYNGTGWSLLKVDDGQNCFTNFDVFDVSGTWTAPVGIIKIMVECWGAGGGGGRGNGGTCGTNQYGGGGGGGGAYAKEFFTVIPGNNYAVTIGTGGAGGTSVTPTGANGSSSNFNAQISCEGGIGGGFGATGYTENGGSGGTSADSFKINGSKGKNGTNNAFGCMGGDGGSSFPMSTPAAGGVSSGNGQHGVAPGAGGGGGSVGVGDGGNGSNGRVLIWY